MKTLLKTTIKYIAIFSISFLLPILPWMIRNYKVFGAFVPLSTSQGLALYSSYKPKDGKIYGLTQKDDTVKYANSLSSEAKESEFLTKETFKLIKDNPVIFFKLLGLKMAYFFSPFNWELIHGRVIYNYLYAFYFPFFVIGSFMALHRFKEFSPIYLPILGVIVGCVIFYGSPRFRLVIEPFMLLLACWAMVNIYKRTHKKLFVAFLVVFLSGNFLFYLNSDVLKEKSKNLLKNMGLW